MSDSFNYRSALILVLLVANSMAACTEERNYSSGGDSTSADAAAGAATFDGGDASAPGPKSELDSGSTPDLVDEAGLQHVDAAYSDAAATLLDGASLDAGEADEHDAKPPQPECSRNNECDDGNECNGVETCKNGRCALGAVEADGTICAGVSDGEFVCRHGNCLKSRCGDGIVDARLEELCDDANVTNGDGCDVNCAYSCSENSQCDDGNLCNGDESCDIDLHVCSRGTEVDDGFECGTDRACLDGRCLSTSCGDGEITEGEECDDENQVEGDGCTAECQFDCEADADCNDNDVCTGQETCDLEAHVCVPGEALECDDEVPCTHNTCEPSGGCRFPLIDEDGDGQAPIFKNSDCGTDCDDDNDQVFAGAGELCDGIDNNCDGHEDEFATVWYPDCDGDGYAPLDSESVQQCDQPSSPASCGSGARGTWTIRPPTSSSDADCWDYDPDIYPRTDAVWNTSAIEGRMDYPFDYNCSYSNEPRYTNVNVPTNSECSPLVLQPSNALPVEVAMLRVAENANLSIVNEVANVQLICTGPSGWEAAAAPACGQPGTYSYCDGCTRVIDVSYRQPCQ